MHRVVRLDIGVVTRGFGVTAAVINRRCRIRRIDRKRERFWNRHIVFFVGFVGVLRLERDLKVGPPLKSVVRAPMRCTHLDGSLLFLTGFLKRWSSPHSTQRKAWLQESAVCLGVCVWDFMKIIRHALRLNNDDVDGAAAALWHYAYRSAACTLWHEQTVLYFMRIRSPLVSSNRVRRQRIFFFFVFLYFRITTTYLFRRIGIE